MVINGTCRHLYTFMLHIDTHKYASPTYTCMCTQVGAIEYDKKWISVTTYIILSLFARWYTYH